MDIARVGHEGSLGQSDEGASNDTGSPSLDSNGCLTIIDRFQLSCRLVCRGQFALERAEALRCDGLGVWTAQQWNARTAVIGTITSFDDPKFHV